MPVHRFMPRILAALALFLPGCTKTYRPPLTACPLDTDPAASAQRVATLAKGSVAAVRPVRTMPYRSPYVSQGMAVLIGAKGLVLTAYHPIASADRVIVSFTLGEREADLALLDRDRDIAVLRLRERTVLPPAPAIARDPPAPGDAVWVPLPDGRLIAARVTDADASIGNFGGLAALDILLADEMAGAPALDACGRLLGIVVWNDTARGRTLIHPAMAALRAADVKYNDLY